MSKTSQGKSCKVCIASRMRGYRRSKPDVYLRWNSGIAARRKHLRVRYGLTIEQYENLLAQQDGVCAICNAPPPKDRRLHVDHDHVTGEVRGLLCLKCNTALERMEHAGWQAAASAYLAGSSVGSEHSSYKAQVVGSNPTRPTTHKGK